MKHLKLFEEIDNEETPKFTSEDLEEAFKAGSRKTWVDLEQTETESYYYSFEEWYKEYKG